MISSHDRLPLVLGAVGHRDPADPVALSRELSRIFRAWSARAPHTPIVLLSALAAGADQIFAEVGLEVLAAHPAGAELIAVLPFAVEDYRLDFRDDPDASARLEALLSRAARVIELPAEAGAETVEWPLADGRVVRRVGSSPDPDGSAARAEHYERLGRFIVVHAHAVVSMWDGWVTAGPGGVAPVGGTAAVTRLCRQGVPAGSVARIPLRDPESHSTCASPVAVLAVPTPRRGGEPAEHCKGPDDDERMAALMAALGLVLERMDAINAIPAARIESGGGLEGLPFHSGARILRSVGRIPAVIAAASLLPLARLRVLGSLRITADDAREGILALFTRPVPGGYLDPAYARAIESAGDPAARRLASIFRRVDAAANLDVGAYQLVAISAVAVLGAALILAQLFSSWPSPWFVGGYLLLLLPYTRARAGLKQREESRAASRGLAELVRVQIAWRVAGIPDLVADRVSHRRALALGQMRALLASTAIIAVGVPCSGRGSVEAAREHWVRDQLRYASEGRSILRKRRKAERRDRRKARLRGMVVVVALLGLAVSIGYWGGARDHALATVSFLIGLSLVAILVTELRGSIALDREDADAAAGMEPIYRAAIERLEAVSTADDPTRAREVLRGLGASVIDEQLEWYTKHRDGAEVDIVG